MSNGELEGGYAASWSAPHHLGSAKQWEPPSFCAVSKRHVGEFNNLNCLTTNVMLRVSSSGCCRPTTRFKQNS